MSPTRPSATLSSTGFVAAHREAGLPVQMHVGLAFIRGSHPLNVAGLIERHPATRFLLMHFAYPWSRDLIGMAASYRNVWLDLTWAQLISPSHFKLALHEAVEALPKVDAGYFSEADAIRLAPKILRENATRFFELT
jgi:predicted TIM-barrel fold metal-dependent hydrolase